MTAVNESVAEASGVDRPRPSTIRRRLMSIILVTTLVGLGIMGAGLIVNSRVEFERSLERDLSIIAEVIGNNSRAALAFRDPQAATDTLQALAADRNVVAAALYDGHGELFAQYWRGGAVDVLPHAPPVGGVRSDGDHVVAVRAIFLDGREIGRILIRSDTGRWSEILYGFLVVLGGLTFLTLAVTLTFSWRLQRSITAPIAHLADTARQVSRDRDYSLRAHRLTNDEIGLLVDSVNTMLTEIQTRDTELRRTQEDLKQHVRELAQEINERKRAESALRDSESRYRVLFENNPQPMWVYDLDSLAFVAVNDAAIQRYGYTRDEFLAMTIADIRPPEDVPALAANVGRVTQGRDHAGVWRHRRKDGAVIDVEIVSHVIQFGGRRCEIVLANDVTERLRAERALRRYSERLAVLNRLDRIISSSLNIHEFYGAFVEELAQLLSFDRTAILVVDETGTHAVVLDQWTDGAPAIDVGARVAIGQSILGRLVRQRAPLVEGERGELGEWPEHAALSGESTRSRALLPLIASNRVIGVLTVASRTPSCYTDAELEVLTPLADQMAVALQNARLYERIQSDAAELERRVAERTAQLEVANKELEAFSYSVSHDLRAPLRAMDGFSNALLQEHADRLDAGGRHYLERIRVASQRMGQLIDDLLNLARVARRDLRLAEVDLSALAAEVMADQQRRWPDRTVDAVVAPGLRARADPNLMRVVLDNLLGNAWKFTQRQTSARIEFGARADAGATVFFVRDNGVGFDMAYVDKLFGAFQRLHANTEFEGTGIGLATVQRVIHRHGGRIWAEAERDRGATFHFTLPE